VPPQGNATRTAPGLARHTAPHPSPHPSPQGPPRRSAPETASPETAPRTSSRGAAHQMPFFVLLCGLLGGALISALVISTTLAEGSFQITKLEQANNALATQRQQLEQQVAAAQSARVIEQRATQLGMLPANVLRFVNLKTGKIATDTGSGAAIIGVPGYTP
jgi:hypothetical protein